MNVRSATVGWLLALSAVVTPAFAADVTFERDIQPILTRAGCNAGACHGKARGQNGFALSLFGFDSAFDHDAIVREDRGRRVFPAAPDESLLLLKAAARVPHGGGPRLPKESAGYATLRQWIIAGMPHTPASAPRLLRIAVEPSEKTVKPSDSFPLRVTAFYSDGSRENVTHFAGFNSSESTVVAVDPNGVVLAGKIPGEAAISARFQGLFASCGVTIPLPSATGKSPEWQFTETNFIDRLAAQKWRKLGFVPSRRADDATFLRRAYVDVIGRVPTLDEARAFLSDKSPNKREKLIDHLLAQPEYADYWANKWADLLRPNPYRVGIKAVFNLDGWIRDSFRRDMPYDEFVRTIVTAKGGTFDRGPATIFRDRREPEEIAPMVSQLFLGIRLECAKCHHHPFESWGQEQFYEFAAFFAKVGRKGTGLSPPISGSQEFVFAGKSGTVKHPISGKALEPKPLFGSVKTSEESTDPRESLARWMTAPENAYFANVMANRVWVDLMGRGIVEPIDDLRATNPPSNGPLLDALGADFRASGFKIKSLIKTIMMSSVYGLDSEPNSRNISDTRDFSRHYRQRLRAEVIIDAIGDITEIPNSFNATAPGTRATGIWTHRTPSVSLDTFGRPDPNQDPPCERTSDTSVVQALHLMNAPDLQKKLTSDEGRVARLAKSKQSPGEIVEELYLIAYGRLPTPDEQRFGLSLFADGKADRRAAIEDLLWALLNTPEFVFKN